MAVTTYDAFGNAMSVPAGVDGENPESFNNPLAKAMIGEPVYPYDPAHKPVDNASPSAAATYVMVDAAQVAWNAGNHGLLQPTGNPVDTGSRVTAKASASTATVTSCTPDTGVVAGNTAVTIAGTNLDYVSAVKFGTTKATSLKRVSETSITCKTPAHVRGAVDIVVLDDSGDKTLSNGFTYTGAPTVTTCAPNTGTTSGGTAVTITGTNFTGATAVTFGGITATSIVVVSDTSITCVTPARTSGAKDLVVTNPDATVTKTGFFTYA